MVASGASLRAARLSPKPLLGGTWDLVSILSCHEPALLGSNS
jgi:hypothetical protein